MPGAASSIATISGAHTRASGSGRRRSRAAFFFDGDRGTGSIWWGVAELDPSAMAGALISWDFMQDKSWPRKFEQADKWNFCLKAAMIAANRRDHEQTTAPEPQPCFQGEGGACRRQGRSDAGPIGRAFRRPPQSGDGLESPARANPVHVYPYPACLKKFAHSW